MKIGIITPCHFEDIYRYFPLTQYSINNLEPKCFVHKIYPNDGKYDLGYYRKKLFEQSFNMGCELVLQCSADFYLHKDILKYVEKNKITTFAYIKHRLSYLIDFVRFKISPDMWTGCYCLPKEFWNYFKGTKYYDYWDGGDYSILCFADEIGYPIKRIRKPKYTLLNPSKDDPFENIENYPLWKRIIRKIAWFDH